MQVGNARYLKPADLPQSVAVFPLSGALLLPGGQLPLNIFEPRYLAMFDAAVSGNRLIGMIQPAMGEAVDGTQLSHMGCLGRITSFTETGDGRYIASLTGICRFRLLDEISSHHPYRSFHIAPFIADLKSEDEEGTVDRAALLGAFKAYLEANKLEADWESVERASNLTLVNSLSMMAPFEPAEKQALLEAPDLKTRAETFIAITEIVLARGFGDFQFDAAVIGPVMDDAVSKVDPKLLDLLVCPLTKGHLSYDRERNELVSEKARLAYPIRDGIPIMLISEARRIED